MENLAGYQLENNGEKRGLGIPTIEDRARQCLIKIALEPQWESKFEENSYGFRPARSCQDAIQAIFRAINQKAKYVLDADISKCFDQIDQPKLLAKLERYADDFVILHENLEVIKDCQKLIENWLKDIGLELKPSKTRIKRWAERRHPNKGKTWVAKKYWHSQGLRNWVFATKGRKGEYQLQFHADTPMVRHTKVKGNRSIYDGDLVYWSSRLGKHPQLPTSKAKLLKKQKGKCNHCGLYFKDGDLMEIDHIIPKSLGGKNESKNLQLLHRHCHDDKTTRDGSLNRAYDKGSISEEPDESKGSCPVLETSQTGDCLA